MAVPGDGVGVTERISKVTLSNWLPTLEDHTRTVLPFWAALNARGKTKWGEGGGDLAWPFRKKAMTLAPYVTWQQLQFAPHEDVDNARLPWRMMVGTEAQALMEELQHRGKAVVAEILDSRGEDLKESLVQQLGLLWHKAGTTANGRFHGIETFGSVGTQTASDELATTPNATYAGKSCAYTTYGAAGTLEYGLWSPVIVSTNRNPLGTGIDTFANAATTYLRTGKQRARRGAASKDNIHAYFVNNTAYMQILELLETKERLTVVRGTKYSLASLGFDTVEYDGVEIIHDEGVPTQDESATPIVVQGYGYNFDQVRFHSMNDKGKLWRVKMDSHLEQLAERMAFICPGQLRFSSPRYQVLLKEIGLAA